MSEINFDKAEKYSYVYTDGKYAKIATSTGGSPTLVDPLRWSYAESHSYVKVDPSSLNVAVPEDVKEIYAKVVYIPGLTPGTITVEMDPKFGEVSAILATTGYVDSKLVEVNDNISGKASLESENIFIGKQTFENAGNTISINNSSDIASIYLEDGHGNITISTSGINWKPENDASGEVSFNDFLSFASKNEIPSSVSQLVNDSEFIKLSDVQALIEDLTARIAALETALSTHIVMADRV